MSQADLATMLTNNARKDGHVLNQLYALFDGSTASLRSVPDIELFSNRGTSELFCGVVLVQVQLRQLLVSTVNNAEPSLNTIRLQAKSLFRTLKGCRTCLVQEC